MFSCVECFWIIIIIIFVIFYIVNEHDAYLHSHLCRTSNFVIDFREHLFSRITPFANPSEHFASIILANFKILTILYFRVSQIFEYFLNASLMFNIIHSQDDKTISGRTFIYSNCWFEEILQGIIFADQCQFAKINVHEKINTKMWCP